MDARDHSKVKRHGPGVSIVATKRNGKLCGYEVWRHFAGDKKRGKARAWFGLRPMGSDGKEVPALEQARRMASFLRSLSEDELRAWWANRHAVRAEAALGAYAREQALLAEKAAAKAQRRADREARAAAAAAVRKAHAAAKAKLKAELAAAKARRQADRTKRREERQEAAAQRRALRAGKVKGLAVQVHRGRAIAYIVIRRVGGVIARASFSIKKWQAKTGQDNAAHDEAVKTAKWMYAESPAALLEWSKRHVKRRGKYRGHRLYAPVPSRFRGKISGYSVQRFGCYFRFPAGELKRAQALSAKIGSMTKEQVFKRLARHRSSNRAVTARHSPLGIAGYDVRVGPVRMYFDKAEWRSQSGYDGTARSLAKRIARRLKAMSNDQLTEFWTRYREIAPRLSAIDSPDSTGVVMDFEGLAQMSHAYRHAS